MPEPLTYREVSANGAGGRTFAPWVNALRNSSGAYVIRRKGDHRVLYIGESHTGRLADTIKRHFYPWRDDQSRKHFTARAGAVQVAVRVTPQNAAVSTQNKLIDRLNPEHNKQGVSEDIPF